MFYQNSNDLVKQASANSGHVQNSHATHQRLLQQQEKNVADVNNDVSSSYAGANNDTDGASLSIGAKFQNAMNNMIGSFSSYGKSTLIEGVDGTSVGGMPGFATPETGPVGVGGDQNAILRGIIEQNNEYNAQENNHRARIKEVKSIVEQDDKTLGKWVQVIDAEGISKYGYLTKDRIFQIWLAPTDPKNNPQNWFETTPIKQNGAVLGCPATSGNLTKFEIGLKWDQIKPFEMVYSKNDISSKTPLFMMTQQDVRNAKKTPNQSGLFSCDNERTNIFVTERPFADFDTSVKTNRQGCYIVNDKVKDSTFNERGFVLQEDIGNSSISQCKRRTEDLGSSYFLITPSDSGQPENRGKCWIYTGKGEPNLIGMLSYDETGKKCHNHSQIEGDEDGYMKSYASTVLPRLYGKTNDIDVSSDPPNPTCDHRMRNGCIFKDYIHAGNATCYPSNRNGAWAYGGLYNYNNNDLKGWLQALHDRNSDGLERPAVNEYIQRCKNTKGYEFLNDNPIKRIKKERSAALYSLKVGGPTGVDTTDRNGSGLVGRIAYVDHNGERHDYPDSALSYMKSAESGKTGTMKYVNIGPYDTRSTESSYSLKEIKPGEFSEPVNLLFKASRDGWTPETFHKKCDNKGPTYTRAIISDGRVLGAYTSLNWASDVQNYKNDPFAFLYDGSVKYTPENGIWGPSSVGGAVYMNSTMMPTFGGGHDFYINGKTLHTRSSTFLTSKKEAPFGNKPEKYTTYNITDIEVYSVDSVSFPETLEYTKRTRSIPVGESINASIEQCQSLCDGDDKCGGFVYSEGGGGGNGKCELKDKTKMYPIGLRVIDHSKKFMLKVPSINGTITDPECAASGDGIYKNVDSTHYLYYPDGGPMTSTTKCNIATMIPKDGNIQMPDITPAINAIQSQSSKTNENIKTYGEQTAISGTSEGFTTSFREGLETAQQVESGSYGQAIADVRDTLIKIGNAQSQRERFDAMKEETNKRLISESYKFILWSILAILAVMAVLKIKEMFGQDEPDEPGSEGGGILGFITSFLGIGSALKMDDIADRTADMKSALSNAGASIQQTGENLANGITEGADNLISSVNNAATNAMDGARNMAQQASEKAAEAVNSIGDAAASVAGSSSSVQNNSTTGGRRRAK
jgi:hypothetical protein